MTKDHLGPKENQVFQVFLVLMALLALLGHLETEAHRVDREHPAGMVTLGVQVMRFFSVGPPSTFPLPPLLLLIDQPFTKRQEGPLTFQVYFTKCRRSLKYHLTLKTILNYTGHVILPVQAVMVSLAQRVLKGSLAEEARTDKRDYRVALVLVEPE